MRASCKTVYKNHGLCPPEKHCVFGEDFPHVRKAVYLARRYEVEYNAFINGEKKSHVFK